MKILIVDDEVNVREGIVRKIEHIQNKKFALLQAGNVDDALKIIEHHHPEIIISDIRLYDLNGLDMIKQVMTKNYSPQVIIISGYSEFVYAQEAINLGVIKYIIKPIDFVQLVDTIGEAVGNIEKNNDNEQSIHAHQKENRLKRVITEKDDTINFLDIFTSVYKNIYAITVKSKTGYRKDMNSLNALILTHIFKQADFEMDVTSVLLNNNKIVYMLTSDKNTEQVKQCLESVFSKVVYEMGINIYAGMSSNDMHSLGPYECYKQSRIALKYRLFGRSNVIVDYKDSFVNEPVIELPIEDYGLLREAIIVHDLKKANSIVERIFGEKVRSELHYNNLLRTYESLINYLFMNVVNPNHKLRENRGITNQFTVDFHSYDSLEEIIVKVKKLLFNVCQELAKLKENSYQNIGMLEVEAYIRMHYNKDISLNDVANHVAVSYTYFSKLFKEEMGESFVNYIKRLRIKKAKELLLDPKLSVKKIAVEVGYNNARHFSKVFEHETGEKPSIYRKRVILGHD